MLQLIYTSTDADLNESKIRRYLGIEQSVASIYLNQLTNAGLIGAERDGVKVYFRPWARGGSTEEFCRVLSEYLRDADDEKWMDDFLTLLKPYSHFNRLAMLARLMDGPAAKEDLLAAAGTVVRTLEHHLRILVSAGLIRKVKRYHEPMTLELVNPMDGISSVMLMYVREAKDAGETFTNVIPQREMDDDSRKVLRDFVMADGLDWETSRKQRMSSRHFRSCDKIAHDEPNHDPR